VTRPPLEVKTADANLVLLGACQVRQAVKPDRGRKLRKAQAGIAPLRI